MCEFEWTIIDILKNLKVNLSLAPSHIELFDKAIDDTLLLENNYQALRTKNHKLQNIINEQRKIIDNKFSTKVRRYISNELFKWSTKIDVKE